MGSLFAVLNGLWIGGEDIDIIGSGTDNVNGCLGGGGGPCRVWLCGLGHNDDR